jgi:hypothetical protein
MSDIETAAREMGWRPKEEFRGDPEKWVDASTWVSRGENFIPILRADRDRTKQKLDEVGLELKTTKDLLQASQEAIENLKKFKDEMTLQRVKDAKREVLQRLRDARDAGDIDKELKLQEELNDLRTAEADAKTKPASAPAPAPAPAAAPMTQLPPDVVEATKAWEGRNPWFKESARKRGLAMGIADEIRSDPKTKDLRGAAFFEELDRQLALEPMFGGERRESKVDGGRPTGGSGSGSKTRGYADLPPEAKAACDSQSRGLVGPGRAFKDEAAWQKYYAEEYFSSVSN